MSRFNKMLKIVLSLVLLVIVAVVIFVATFDANTYKPQIIEQVENATGRDFSIDDDISLSVFPWIGLKVENAWLGNAKGFSANKFAAIKQLDIKVNVLPLLKKQVEINTIRLHGLNVSLEVAKNKTNNWSDLSQGKTADDAADKVVQDEQSASASSPLQSLKVEGFEFVDAHIVYDDRSTGSKATVSDLNLQTSAIEFDKPVEVSFSAHINNSNPAIDTRLALETKLTFNETFNVFNLNDLVFTVFTKANEFIKQDEEIKLTADIDVLLQKERADIKQLKLSALGTDTVMQATITNLLKTPLINADVEVLSFNAREVAQRAGVVLPEMARADALNTVALKTKIKQQGQLLELNKFNINLDDSKLTGWIHVIDIAKQSLRYQLAFDQLDLNDYLPPTTESPEVEVAQSDIKSSDGTTAAAQSTGDERIELPLDMMRQLDIAGEFSIAKLIAMDYDISQFLMKVSAKQGMINIKPLSMNVLDGKVTSVIGINVSKDIPAYDIALDVSKVQLGPVANPFLVNIMGDKPLSLKGAANVDMAIKTSGETVNQLKKASIGKIVLDMNQTEVNGFDPEYYMRSSVASYLDESGFGLSKTIMGSYSPREVTVFDTIHSTVKLANGKADTQDFLMDSKRVQVGAKGYADIIENSMDVTSSVKLARSKTALEKVLDQPIFVRIHGPFEALEYSIDTKRLKESTIGVLEQEAKAKLDAEKQRVKEKLEAEKQRAKAKLEAEKQRAKDKLDAEKRAAEEKAKQKIEDELKDKFKGLF